MINSANLTTYTLGGSSFLAYFENVSFSIEAKTEETKGGAARHSLALPVKRMFEVQTSIMQFSTSFKSALDLSVFTLGATDYTATVKNFSLTVNTVDKECSARADEFETFQAVGTKFNGSFDLMLADAATTQVVFDLVNGSRSGLATSISVTIGATVLVLPILLKKATQKVNRDDLVINTIEFEQRGVPTTVSGNTLLASILTGTGLITAVLTMTNNAGTPASMGTYTGATLISSATLTIPDEGLVKEQYTFKGLGVPVRS